MEGIVHGTYMVASRMRNEILELNEKDVLDTLADARRVNQKIQYAKSE